MNRPLPRHVFLMTLAADSSRPVQRLGEEGVNSPAGHEASR